LVRRRLKTHYSDLNYLRQRLLESDAVVDVALISDAIVASDVVDLEKSFQPEPHLAYVSARGLRRERIGRPRSTPDARERDYASARN